MVRRTLTLNLKPRIRADHARKIREQLQKALEDDAARSLACQSDRHGLYLTFVSEPGFDLVCKSLEVRRLGIRLLNVRTTEDSSGAVSTLATLEVPKASAGHFFKRILQYEMELSKVGGKPKNANLIESIAEIRRAILEQAFWTDPPDRMPKDAPDWVEVWLSPAGDDVKKMFTALCERLHIETSGDSLRFPEREVILVRANRSQLEQMIEYFDHIAEFRAASVVASFFLDQENRDQAQRAADLLLRTRLADQSNVAVLILAHGVNHGHQLLSILLDPSDKHTVIPSWGTHDHHGHGTLMAGLAGYGNLLEHLQSVSQVLLSHRLESAKILPPPTQEPTPKRLWGLYTAQGISRAEIQAPERKRIICMAVSSLDKGERGRPSSWSAEVDALCSGASDGERRLVLLSAGNLSDAQDHRIYPESNKTKEVHEPGQAWNALTVGAYTRLTEIDANVWPGYSPVAPADGLSPHSSTSLNWVEGGWPIKPEILLEGGNVAKGPNGGVVAPDSLQLLSTHYDPQTAQFEAFNATSAACAQAAHLAARLQAEYPGAHPETIRGLLVHSAEWTETQRRQFLADGKKGSYRNLARICGYGVPDIDRALHCARNSLTLIAESAIQPFAKKDSGSPGHHEMHMHSLPWPKEILLGLGEMIVRMRVTLSYFIEPSPGEVGWESRYRYPSHGLRFELIGPGESEAEFVQRINAAAREAGASAPGSSGPREHWILGGARNTGSIHSDIWEGTAAQLAASNRIVVHPSGGWWRERAHLGRLESVTRYSLLVSIHLPGQDVDIYTPVAVQIGVTPMVAIPISTSSS